MRNSEKPRNPHKFLVTSKNQVLIKVQEENYNDSVLAKAQQPKATASDEIQVT